MRIKLGLAVVAAFALSIAITASASAAGFLASKAEKLLAEKTSAQIFTTDQGEVNCGTVNILAGTTSTSETTSQEAEVDYENCKAFTFIEVQISKAIYLFQASGSVIIDKLIKIFVPADSCEISVPAQTVNSVDYETKGNNILIEPLVNGIHYTQGTHCNVSGALTNGTYKGHIEVMIPSGTVSFMK
jgi:dGTP triphosphohydrolase